MPQLMFDNQETDRRATTGEGAASGAYDHSHLPDSNSATSGNVLHQNERVLGVIAGTSNAASSEEFFSLLVRSLASALGVSSVVVARMRDDSLSYAQTLAVYHDGQTRDNFDFELRGTLLEPILRRTVAFYPQSLKSRQGPGRLMQELEADSLLAVPLIGTDGRTIGLLAAADRRPIRDGEAARSLLTLFAERASAELERQLHEAASRHHRGLLNLIAMISARFINMPIGQMDEGINNALRAVGEIAGVDRAYVFSFSGDASTMTNTHEWCAPGIPPQMHELQRLPATSLPWGMERMRAFDVMHVPRVRDLPAAASSERAIFESGGIQSLICVPMVCRHTLVGFVGFDSVRTEKHWGEDDIALLRIVGEIIANALERKRSEDELREREVRLRLSTEQIPAVLWTTDRQLNLMTVTGAALRTLKLDPTSIVGQSVAGMFSAPEAVSQALETHRRALTGESVSAEIGWHERIFQSHVEPLRNDQGRITGTVGIAVDATERKQSEQLSELQQRILERIAMSGSLADVLNALCRHVERVMPGALCSVMLLDPEDRNLKLYAGPSLLPPMTAALASLTPGPASGSCGAAAYTGTAVFVEDIRTDDRWHDLRAEAEALGIRACWSIPILSESQSVVATFGITFTHTAKPTAFQRRLLETARHLAGIAIRHQHAREALSDSEQKWRSIAENSADYVIIIDPEFRIVFINRTVSDLSVSEVIGSRITDFLDGRNAEIARACYQRVLSSGQPDFYECSYTPGGEGVHYFACRVGPIRQGERVVALTVSATDVTDTMRAQRALRDSEERFRQMSETIDEVFWLTDWSNNRVVYVSPAYERVWGRTCQSLYDDSRSWADSIHPDDRDRAYRAFVRDAESGNYDIEYRLRLPDGTERWIHDRAFPIHDESGRVYRLAGISEDVTERKEAEMQLSRARRLEAAGQLAGQIAHDFNNLLGPVLAYPELIRMQIEPDSPVARMLSDIEDAATQMAEINQQLLTLSRRGHYNIEAVDMNALTERTLRTLEIPESITVDCRLGSDLLPARGGRAQLARVIANLIQNAHEAMGNDGTLTLKTELVYLDTDVQRYELIPAGEYVLWSVGDSGGGIDPGITNKIFDPFFTTKSSDKRRGSGLGLAVVHSVVHDHDGYIDVESTPNVGTTFRLYLPVERTLDVAADDPDEIPHGHNEHILVADDDPLQRRLAHTALERLGYTVTLATCGEEAVDLAARQSFDLLILDMIMDGIDGAETYARICRTHPQQKAIVLSGYASGDRVEDAINLGVRQFLPKPVRLPALANAIHAALHSDNGGRPASVTTSRG